MKGEDETKMTTLPELLEPRLFRLRQGLGLAPALCSQEASRFNESPSSARNADRILFL